MAKPFEGPHFCPVCSKEVYYRLGRRRCSTCGRWCHDRCSIRNGHHYSSRSICHECTEKNGPTLAQIECSIEEIDEGLSSSDLRIPALIFMTSIWVGPNDEEKIQDITDISLEEISPVALRLRKSQIWSEDGKIQTDEIDESDGGQVAVMLMLMIMCGSGHVKRTFDNDPSVDHKTEISDEQQ